MSKHLPKADEVDVMILAEGTYPYVKGGSLHGFINLLPDCPINVLGSVLSAPEKRITAIYNMICLQTWSIWKCTIFL